MALGVSTAILRGMQEDGYFPGHEPQHVSFDTADRVWIVDFREETGTPQPGSSLMVVLRAQDGSAIKRWLGE